MAGINFDFTTGVLPGAITFTRASIGTYNSSGNILTTASNNVARFNYIGGVANLLIEPSATNLVVQSNNFSAANWALANGAVVTAAQFVSPDGANSGWSLSSGTGNGGVYTGFTFSALTYTMSVWAKWITGTPNTNLFMNSTTLTIATTATLTRISRSQALPGGADSTMVQAVAGAGSVDGIYGCQLETGSVMTSYIPTTATSVTRAADSAVFTIPTGITALQFTFDDGSKQVVSVTPGPYTIPTNLNRANIKSIQSAFVLDFTTGSLPGGVTLTRPSIGTYTSNAGLLITAGNDVARFNYVSGVANLLIEPSATNLALQSNAFATTWTTGNSAVLTAAQFVSPDGTNDGWSLNGSLNAGYLLQPATYAAGPYTASIWAKLLIAAAPINLMFNFSANPVAISATLARVFSTGTPGAGGGSIGIQVRDGSGPASTHGIFGFQVETGNAPTSYIPTTTTSVTRAADSATFTVPSGINLLTYTFDDNSTQAVPVSPGPYTVPVTLARPNIKSIVGTTVPPPNFDFTTGVLPAGITFTRASIGTYTNNAGTLITAGNDVARFNYVGGVANLLIEGSATNMLPQSNNFSTAPWALGGGGVVTAAQFISPDGSNNGWSLTSSTSNGFVQQPSITYTNVPYVISAWIKQIVGTAQANLNIANAGSVFPVTTTIARYLITRTPSAGVNNALIQTVAATGNTNGIYGMQLELGSIPTSYIPTGAAAVTRAADSATFIIPSGINQLVYTFDDNSTQTVAVSPGSYTIPTTLARPNIKSVVGRYAFDFTSGSLPAGMTFTRPSIGTYTNAAGTLITAGNDVARFNYVGGGSCLLIEPSATNLLKQSNNFLDGPSWLSTSSGSPNPTAAQFISPDGTNNGWSISSGTGNGFVGQDLTFSNISYAMSIWAKSIIGTSPISLWIADKQSAATLPISSTIARISYIQTPTAGASSVLVQIQDVTGKTDGIYGAQLELGSKMTSYIPTGAAAVTRAADAAVFTVPAGVNALLYTFDDGSTQQVSVTAGSYTIPVNLNRPNIKSIQGLGGFDFTGGTLPPGITFTRASIGTYFDSGNILRTASNNVARMNYVSGVSCLLIEASATNLLLQSNNFINAAWVNNNGVNLGSAQFISPDGTNNGWSFNSGTPLYGGVNTAAQIAFANSSYTASLWSKNIVGSDILGIIFGPGLEVDNTLSATITRYSATRTIPGIAHELTFAAISGIANNSIGAYGAQLELGSKATSYIPTTTTAVTRAVDQATFTVPTGVTQLTYTFDDNSTQTVSATPGSYTIPTTLSRPNIKSIAWVTTTVLGATITLQCAKCGFYMITTSAHNANIIAAKHTAGWGPAHIVSVT